MEEFNDVFTHNANHTSSGAAIKDCMMNFEQYLKLGINQS
jgi:hypothetical protein